MEDTITHSSPEDQELLDEMVLTKEVAGIPAAFPSDEDKQRERVKATTDLIFKVYKVLRKRVREGENIADGRYSEILKRLVQLAESVSEHTVYIQQIVQLLDSNGDKVTILERELENLKRQMTELSRRQDRLMSNIKTVDANTKTINDELVVIRKRLDGHDRFEWKITVIVTITGVLAGYILSNSQITKLIENLFK